MEISQRVSVSLLKAMRRKKEPQKHTPEIKAFTATMPNSIQTIIQEIIQMARPEAIILFGSRARGTARETSDFDLAVRGKKCREDEWVLLSLKILEDPLTLYSVDLVELEKLNKEYQSRIDEEGVILYG